MFFASNRADGEASVDFHFNCRRQRPSLACAEIVRTRGLVFRPTSLLRNKTIRWRRTGLLVTWIEVSHWRSSVNKPEFINTTKSLKRSLSRESIEVQGPL